MHISKSIIRKSERNSTEKFVRPSVKITKNTPAKEECINPFDLEANEQDPVFILDPKNLVLAYFGTEEFIDEYAGIKATAKLGNNSLDIFIPANAMQLLLTLWKVTEG